MKTGNHNAIRSVGGNGNCYMHLRAGGAGTIGALSTIRSEAKLAQATTIILTVHVDCKKCPDSGAKIRNLRINLALARKWFKDKRVVGMIIGLDGQFSRV